MLGRSLVRRAALALALAALPALSTPSAHAAGGADAEAFGGVYIVRLAEAPVAAYRGGVGGIPPTSPAATGRPLRLASTAAKAYRGHLDEVQDRVLARASRRGRAVTPQREYRTTLAGFAAQLSPGQVRTLSRDARVVAVEPNELLQLDATPSTPPAVALGGPVAAQSAQHLGLPDGLWSRLGGPMAADGAGDGKVIGIIDSGLDASRPSFADDPSAGYLGAPFGPPPAHFEGTCASGSFTCNGKVVGARYFLSPSTQAALAPGNAPGAADTTSGHGTHVAGIAAGNYGVDPEHHGNDFDVDVLSGIAPRARIAVYKVCWLMHIGSGSTTSCPTVETLAAYEAAVADGVDVANFSIGTSYRALPNATAHAILAAQEAGLVVAQSAGNSAESQADPTNSVGATTANWWALAVGATTGAGGMTDRSATITVPGATPLVVHGSAAATTAHPPSPVVPSPGTESRLVDAAAHAASGVGTDAARRCDPGSLSGVPTGAVVVCDRGTSTIAQKAQTVAGAGGSAAVIVDLENTAPNLNAGAESLPVVRVSAADGSALRQRAASLTASARVKVPAWRRAIPDVLAGFSSRGPVQHVPALMPVAVAAPGVDVLSAYPAALALGGVRGVSGTSMASPQIAGVAALMEQARPDHAWTPDEIRSALATTAKPVKLPGGADASAYDVGGGRVDPQAAADPGLVVREVAGRYREAARAIDPGRGRDLGRSRDATTLNVPYLSLREVTGPTTVRRTLTNIDATSSTWAVDVPARAGWTLGATPTLTVPAGGSATLEVQVAPAQASPAAATTVVRLVEQGAKGRELRLPLMLQAVAKVDAPQVLTAAATGAAGAVTVPGETRSTSWTVASQAVTDLVPDSPLATHGFDAAGTCDWNGGTGAGNRIDAFTVASGTDELAVRTRVIGFGAVGPNADVDLYLYAPGQTSPTHAATSASGAELLRVPNPAAGEWRAEVANCGQANLTEVRVTRFSGQAGTPVTLQAGSPFLGAGERLETRLSWTGLPTTYPFGDYIARLTTTDANGARHSTLVAVEVLDQPVLSGLTAETEIFDADATEAAVALEGQANPRTRPTWARVVYDGEPPAGAATDPVYLGSGNAPVPFRIDVGLRDVDDPGSVRVVLERRGTALATETVPVAIRRPPAATTLAATEVTPTSALVSGSVDPNGTPTTARFSWGIGEATLHTTSVPVGAADRPVPLSHHLTGLQPSTTYVFRADALRSGELAAHGDTLTFTTPAAPGSGDRPPTAETLQATAVTATTAVIAGFADPNGTATTARFAYGIGQPTAFTPAVAVGAGDEPVPYAYNLTGLAPSTTYAVRADALRDGELAGHGQTVTFTTAAATGPPPPPDVLTPVELQTAVETLLEGRVKLRGKVRQVVRVRTVKVSVKPGATLTRAKAQLLPLPATGVPGTAVDRARLGTVRGGRSRTVRLDAGPPGAYLLVVDGRQRGKRVRVVQTVVVPA